MNEKDLFIYFLSQFDLPANKIESILEKMGQDYSFSHFCRLNFKELSQDIYKKMIERADERFVKAYIENLEALEIKLVCKLDENFPKKLRNIPEAPFFLFYKGDLSLLDKHCIAIVGSRMPTNYGRRMTEKFTSFLAKNGLVIVSGLAYGIDSIAHRQTLNEDGKTVAVLGSGFNNIYPPEHHDLANQIAEKGLILTEYCPSTKATRYTFPSRNRIIAGLSDGVLITEASIKSGTLYTRDYALDYGKDVFAIPGNIDSEKSALPNEIISSGQGMCVTDPKQILNALNIDFSKQNTNNFSSMQLSFEENQICSLLASGAKNIEFLEKNSNLSINILNSCLTILEIRGIISRMPGGEYYLK